MKKNEEKKKEYPIDILEGVQLRACPIDDGYFIKGYIDSYDFEATVLCDTNDKAINKGHIIKLDIEFMGGTSHCDIPRPVAVYNRKWEFHPEPEQEDDEEAYVEKIVAFLEIFRIVDSSTMYMLTT
jgi:hypothetical protein